MSREEFLYWLRGIPRSLTMWFAAIVAATPLWWGEVEPVLADWLGSESRAQKALTTAMAITIIWLRVRGPGMTVAEKGGKPNELPRA